VTTGPLRAQRIGRKAIVRAVLVISAAALVVPMFVPGAHAASGANRRNLTLRLDLGSAPLIAGARVDTLPQAVRAFGRPARLSAVPGSTPSCRASWPALALAIEFSTAGPGVCVPRSLGSWTQVTATGARWHTRAGLYVGASEARLHALYPDARRLDFLGQGRIWELETGGPYCDGGPPLSLGARVPVNRVGALVVLHVPACG
jgi:hypothetical protein